MQIKQKPTSTLLELNPAIVETSCNNNTHLLPHLFLKLKLSNKARNRQQQQKQQHHHYHLQEQHLRTRSASFTPLCYLSSVIVVLGVIFLPLPPQCDAVGYSYTRFSGPVSGPEHRIYVRDRGGVVAAETEDDDDAAHLDYVAKPEYEFAYGVEDAQAQILHNRNEMRDGDAVKGVYSVVDPDGTLRVVKYTADDINGFQAEVIMNGISAIHGQLQQNTPTLISQQNSNEDYNGYHDSSNAYPPYSNIGSQQYHTPSNYYPTPVHHGNPAAATIHDYNKNINDHSKDYPNNDKDYQPQYEVHERPNQDDENDGDDHHVGDNEDDDDDDNNNDQTNEQPFKNKKDKSKDKQKDYDEDDDGDEDEDDDGDDYDESGELVDYDEAVKSNEASDEYY